MVLTAQARVSVLLVVLLGTVGCLAAMSAPAGTHVAGMWPVGLASGLLVHVTRRVLPWATGLVLVLAFATIALAGYPVEVAAGYATAITLEATVTQRVLGVRWGEGRRFRDDLDLGRYTLAAVLGAATGGALFALTSAVAGFGVPWSVGLATMSLHLTSQLILVAFFLEEFRHPGVSGVPERVGRWALTIAATLTAFVPTHLPAMLFFLLPLLGWTALRASMRETLWQLLAVAVLSSTLVMLGRGPFVALEVYRDRPAELGLVPHHTFLLGCALVCIPFALAVSRQRVSTAEAATERERLQRIVAAASAMAIIETDDLGRITLFNPGAEEILGYREQEVLGHWPDMFVSRAEVARIAEALHVPDDIVHVGSALADPEAGPSDVRCLRKDGDDRAVSMSVSPIPDHLGAVVGYLITAEDITERVRTHEVLEAALVTERRAVARLTEVDRTKDAFVSGVSHELRTPITNIVGYLELLRDGAYGDTSAEVAEALGRIDSNSHRLLELIDDLLTLSSVESLDVEPAREPVDLRAVIRQSSAMVGPDLVERAQRLVVQLPDEPVIVLGDADHLTRMVHKLSINAVKFTPEGGTIVLRVRRDGERCAIEVQDTGVGIPDDEQPLLFNRFFRARHARTEAIKGSGLGLTIARSIAHQHGARISATSTPGRGSVFTVTFSEPDRSSVPTPRTSA